MKIMHESKKEALPLDFITSFVSKSWEEIGNIKANIEGIHQAFTGTSKIEEILQNLVDAYLICVGQLELYIDKKDYLDLPSLEKINESLKEEVEEEDFTGTPEERTTHLDYVDPDPTDEKAVLPDNITKEEDDHCEKNPVINHDPDDKNVLKEELKESKQAFEFFTDFDEPEKLDEGYTPFKEWTSTHNS
jgi:hypothetical protein